MFEKCSRIRSREEINCNSNSNKDIAEPSRKKQRVSQSNGDKTGVDKFLENIDGHHQSIKSKLFEMEKENKKLQEKNVKLQDENNALKTRLQKKNEEFIKLKQDNEQNKQKIQSLKQYDLMDLDGMNDEQLEKLENKMKNNLDEIRAKIEEKLLSEVEKYSI